MNDTTGAAGNPAPPAQLQNVQPTDTTAWVGWIAFAGVLMMLVGVLHAIQGIVALVNDEYYLVTQRGLLITADFTTWGWVHILGGVLLVLAGIGVFAGQVWARSVGVALAFLSVLVNISFLSAYPLWSLIMITVDLLVIWALTVHGHEMRA